MTQVEAPAAAPTPALVPPPTRRFAWDASRLVEQAGDFLLGAVRRVYTPDRYELVANYLSRRGHDACLIAAGLALVLGLVFAADSNELSVFGVGLGLGAALLIAQYIACKVFRAASAMLAATPSELSTPSLLSALGLVAMLTSVGVFVAGIYYCVRARDLDVLWPALVSALFLQGIAWIALNPGLVQIRITPAASAGQEAIALAGFFAKALLRLAPAIFGVGLALALLQILLSVRVFVRAGSADLAMALFQIMVTAIYGAVLFFALSPLLIYLAFLVIYFILDLAGSVLRVCNRYSGSARPG